MTTPDRVRVIIVADVDPDPGKHVSLEDVRASLQGGEVFGTGADDGYRIGALSDVSVRPSPDKATVGLHEFEATYVRPGDRFVVAMLDGWSDTGTSEPEPVRTPQEALRHTIDALAGDGAEMVRRQRAGGPARPPATRVPLGIAAVGSLEELAGALEVADRAERQLVRSPIAEVERQPLHVDDAGERHVDGAWLETVRGERFAGHSCAATTRWCTCRWSRAVAGEQPSSNQSPCPARIGLPSTPDDQQAHGSLTTHDEPREYLRLVGALA
jgi:hypothetical protein